jgi:hypothetical protein
MSESFDILKKKPVTGSAPSTRPTPLTKVVSANTFLWRLFWIGLGISVVGGIIFGGSASATDSSYTPSATGYGGDFNTFAAPNMGGIAIGMLVIGVGGLLMSIFVVGKGVQYGTEAARA